MSDRPVYGGLESECKPNHHTLAFGSVRSIKFKGGGLARRFKGFCVLSMHEKTYPQNVRPICTGDIRLAGAINPARIN